MRLRGEPGAGVTAGLVAHYALDEAGGREVQDALGPAAGGTLRRQSAAGRQGKIGGALSFDGATYVEIGTASASSATDKFSYGAWIYPTSKDAMTVVSRMDDDATSSAAGTSICATARRMST